MILIAQAIAFHESEESRAFLYMITHDPLAVIGWFLIGASGVLFSHVLLSLERAGDKSYRKGISLPGSIIFTLPTAYLKRVRADHWSPWPLYLAWAFLILGVGGLVVGLFRL
jgi:hypothetical protein